MLEMIAMLILLERQSDLSAMLLSVFARKGGSRVLTYSRREVKPVLNAAVQHTPTFPYTHTHIPLHTHTHTQTHTHTFPLHTHTHIPLHTHTPPHTHPHHSQQDSWSETAGLGSY